MEQQIEQLLAMIRQPAFLVEDGRIQWHNPAAKNLVFCQQDISTLLEGGQQLYRGWDRKNLLQIDVKLLDLWYTAKVQLWGSSELFILEQPRDMEHSAAAMINTSGYLRRILHDLMNAGNAMQDQLAELDIEVPEAELMNRSMYQLLRLCGQLSDGSRLVRGSAEFYPETTDIYGYMQAFVDRLSPLLEESGWKLEYLPCEPALRGEIDRDLIQRALYNMISNALRHAPRGSALRLQVSGRGREIHFTLGHEGETFSDPFAATGEHLGLGSPTQGIGLGMEIIRSIARLHGGTLMHTSGEDGTGVIMTFSVRKSAGKLPLRSPKLSVDYCSGLDHGLVELSDVLDSKLYHPDRI